MTRAALLEAGLAGMAGGLLFGLTAGLERHFGAGPISSALLEELGKTVLLLGFGLSGLGSAPDRNPLRAARSRALGLARGLSLGLVAVTLFAGAENIAYLIAFPEFGVLGRLLWSLPVHLVAALLEALGLLFLLRWLGTRSGLRWRLVGVACALAGLALASTWHAAANLLVADRLGPGSFAAGVATALLLFLVLMSQFLRQAYLGGFLHGAE